MKPKAKLFWSTILVLLILNFVIIGCQSYIAVKTPPKPSATTFTSLPLTPTTTGDNLTATDGSYDGTQISTPPASASASPLASPISSPSASPDLSPTNSTPKPKSASSKVDHIIYYDNGEEFWGLGDHKLLYSNDNGKNWTDISPKDIQVTSAYLAADTLLAIQQTPSKIAVYQTPVYQQGTKPDWDQGFLPIKDSWETGARILFANNWLLLTSDTPNPRMSLYNIRNSKQDWHRIGEITGQIAGKPSGISFLNDQQGWITVEQGNNETLLYRTVDGGKTWKKQPLIPPKEIQGSRFTANVYPPQFDEEGDAHMTLPVEIRLKQDQMMIYYESIDHGKTWKLASNMFYHVKRPPAYLLDPTGLRGWALDEDGSVLHQFTLDMYYGLLFSGPIPAAQTIHLNQNLHDATEFFLRTDDEKARGWAIVQGTFYIPINNGEDWITP
jgi:hypothetical protein